MSNPYINSAFFARLEAQSLMLKKDLTGFFGGKHLTNKYGDTVEFADYREYQLGDDIRRIDWNLYSRFEKHYVRLFTDERQMHIQIYLDGSASMGRAIEKKGHYAAAVAAGLGFLAVQNMDKLSFHVIHTDSVEDSGIIVGKNEFYRHVADLQNLTFDGDGDIGTSILHHQKHVGRDGLVILISDFLTDSDWREAVDFFCCQGKQVLLVQVLAEEEIAPSYNGKLHLIDAESLDLDDGRNLRMKIDSHLFEAYEEALEQLYEEIRSFALSRGCAYARIHTGVPLEQALFGELMKVGILT